MGNRKKEAAMPWLVRWLVLRYGLRLARWTWNRVMARQTARAMARAGQNRRPYAPPRGL